MDFAFRIFDPAYRFCHCEEGAFLRPTRQSLTMRFAIPKRTMVERNDAADLMFFVINIPFCYVLPCFATGCRTFGLKIATAALRPRNDTGSERVYLENRGFGSYIVCFRPGYLFSSRLSCKKTAVRTETRSHGGFGMRRALRERSLRRLRRMQPVCKNYSRLEKCLMVRTI